MFYEPNKQDKKKYQDYSIVILTPCGDYKLHAKFAKSVANMIAYSWMHGLKIYQMGITERMVVHWARNDLARTAKDKLDEYTGKKYTHILWLDDDHVFNPDLAVYLAANGELDMVSALYYGREKPLPVVYVKDDTDDKYRHFPLVYVPPNLIEVDAVGMGACLMRRDVLDRVPEPWFTFNSAGEDIYFCVHAKEAGIKIYCDGSYGLGHIGPPQIVTKETHENYMNENKAIYQDKIKVAFNGARS